MAITRRELLRSAGLVAGTTMLGAEASKVAQSGPLGPKAMSGDPVDIPDYERLAPAHLSEMAWEFMSGGAADELARRWNHEA